MSASLATTLLATLAVAQFASAATTGPTYKLKTDLSGPDFFNNFDLYTGPDPTHGFVQYQNWSSAIDNELIGYIDDSVFLGVDYKTKDPKGRASVRAESTINFNHGLLVADIKHMPSSECGSWPAFWLLGKAQWPLDGEIDILEGVNDEVRNAVTLHTAAGCAISNASMPATGGDFTQEYTGVLTTDDCDVNAADQDKNVGCSIKAPAALPASSVVSGEMVEEEKGLPSYGTPFNAAGGGIYALEWTKTHIQAWFFPRNAAEFPIIEAQISNSSSSSPDPSSWGVPIAKFAGEGCDWEERFKDLRIIFNTAFCGDWAGAEEVWASSCAAKTGVDKCEDYVRDHPEAFEEAYWEIKGLRWFEPEETEGKSKRGVEYRNGRHFRW
jgi:hypothetical protein